MGGWQRAGGAVKIGRLALLLALIPLLAGCFGPGGLPLSDTSRESIAESLEEVDRLDPTQTRARIDSLEQELAPIADSKDAKFQDKAARLRLLIGYCWESVDEYDEALSWYKQTVRSQYASVAYLRIADIAEYMAKRPGEGDPAGWRKEAISALERGTGFRLQFDPVTKRMRGPYTLVRVPTVGRTGGVIWERDRDIVLLSRERLDGYYRDRLIYRFFAALVSISSWAGKNGAYIVAIALLAILAKLITTPLSASQFRSMRAMQRLQPEIKKLQEKYKDDKQQLAKAQMQLFKDAKINPMSSCLPMLIQMPILIWVYYGIRYFVYRFENVHFLYLSSLANPDFLIVGGRSLPGPLLLLYAVSMYFSQKLIAAPAATPEQEQQQKLMTYMMPVMFLFILKDLPAAFILYWFLQNILMTGHQFLMMRTSAAQVAAAATAGPPPTRPKPAGPPPEALEKLSQGRARAKKKKRRY
ncbi:MAG: YidC/Oxa1 family membrane protein insertase [Armatimonadota bacterium]